MTRHDQDIEQATRIVYDVYIYDLGTNRAGGSLIDIAREMNVDGFSYDVRYRPYADNYVSDSEYTRVEGQRFSDKDLQRIATLAASWESQS